MAGWSEGVSRGSVSSAIEVSALVLLLIAVV
jgi:hypothetical protein